MNTPRTAFAALALALATPAWADAPKDVPEERMPTAGADNPKSNYNQGTTADGRTIVAPGTFGPFQGPTCEAGSSGCSAAQRDAAEVQQTKALNNAQTAPDPLAPVVVTPQVKLPDANTQFAQLQDGLNGVGALQRNDSVKASEDAMVKSGVYASIERDKFGDGAVITMPDGSIAYSDYVHGFDTIPRKPEDILMDAKASPAMRAAAQKAIDSKAQAKQDKSVHATDVGGGRVGFTSTSPKGAQASATGQPGAGGDTASDSTDPSTTADTTGMGGFIASGGDPAGFQGISGSGGSGGSGGFGGTGGTGGPTASSGGASSDKARADNQQAQQEMTRQAVETAGSGSAEGFTYIPIIREIQEGAALKALGDSAHGPKDATSGAADVMPSSRGSKIFGH